MRRILVDKARRKRSRKHGGGLVRQDIEAAQVAAPEVAEDLLALDEALTALAGTDPPPGAAGRAPLLRGPDPEAGGRSAGHLVPNRRFGLGLRPGLAARRAEGRRVPDRSASECSSAKKSE